MITHLFVTVINLIKKCSKFNILYTNKITAEVLQRVIQKHHAPFTVFRSYIIYLKCPDMFLSSKG